MTGQIRQNSIKSWLLGIRPKTLIGAAVPVIIGGAFAWRHIAQQGGNFSVTDFLLCLFFAFFMQIDANLINDYFDFKKGGDREDRVGPERVFANGWITQRAMERGIVIVTVVSALTGLPLAVTAGWEMIIVGAICILFAFLYTLKLSYLGLGDVAVLVFFGIVPVGFTYFIQTGCWHLETTLAALASGFAIDCLLIINNQRDRFQDAENGKRTIAVRFGRKFSIILYYMSGILAALLGATAIALVKPAYFGIFLSIYLTIHLCAADFLRKHEGKELNKVFELTALNILLFGITTGIAVII